MALDSEELRRRVVAATALQGLGMRSLRDVLGRFGASRTLAEAMIKGTAPQSPRNIRDLSEALGMPQSWFTARDWRDLIRDMPITDADLAAAARGRVAAALDADRERQHSAPDTRDRRAADRPRDAG